MYNPVQKERYLSNCKYEDSTKELIRRIFTSTEMEENIFHKDISLFNQDEVYDLLVSLNSKSRNRLKSVCVFLSDYFTWCYNEGLTFDINDPFDRYFTDTIIQKIIPAEKLGKKFFSKKEILDYLDNIMDVSNKFMIYCLYKGVKFDELVNLKIGDMNYNEKTIKLITGRVLKVDDLFADLLMETNNQTHYYPYGTDVDNQFGRYTYGQSDFILKTCGVKESRQIKMGVFINRLRVIKEQCENDFISVSTLYKNGLYNYIKEQYESKGITLKQAFFEQRNLTRYTYEEDTQKYINEFGSGLSVRSLRKELRDYSEIVNIL
jgi:hypothetical protein